MPNRTEEQYFSSLALAIFLHMNDLLAFPIPHNCKKKVPIKGRGALGKRFQVHYGQAEPFTAADVGVL